MSQSCWVVGVGPGIGQAVAMAFALEGMDVALMSRNPAKLADACAEIRNKSGRQARAYTADAGNDASLRATLAKAGKDLGEPEVLVFNAATAQMGKPTTIPTDRLLAEFQANVVGALTCAKAVAPGMVERGRGTILITGGGFAQEPAAEFASLSLCKAALRSLTYTLAQELGTHGVHVATITVHGFVQTGTRFDPHRIAESFVQLHRQPKGHFDIELIYK